MNHITVVIEYADGQEMPAFTANMELLGGHVTAVQFNDALAEIEQLEQNSCGDCTDGWKYNRVEGRHACTCMTEMEPFQMLQTALEEIANGTHTAEQMPAIACEALVSVLGLGAASAGYVVPEYVPRQVSMDSVRKAIDGAMAPFYQMDIDDFTIEEVDSAVCHELNKL